MTVHVDRHGSIATDLSRLDKDSSRLPGSARVGRVRLAVSDLVRSVDFYSRVIGLAVLEREDSIARLGAGDLVLLELEERAGVRPVQERSRLGLYHTAFLLPGRLDLALFVAHLLELRVGFAGGDHLVSEAIYLVDPDGLEVEVYADRSREVWPFEDGHLRMGTYSVRFGELGKLAAESGAVWQGAPVGTRVGHVHFYVGNLRQAEAFYCAAMGMDVMAAIPSALFVAAGGYHHHVGLNVWAAGSPVASEEDARLLFWELALPDAGSVESVAARLRKAGYADVVTAHGLLGFVDDSGITVALVDAGLS